jgi:predicted phosphoribosyltransferase
VGLIRKLLGPHAVDVELAAIGASLDAQARINETLIEAARVSLEFVREERESRRAAAALFGKRKSAKSA